MKPEERIKEIAHELAKQGIDPGFYGYQPQIGDWVLAIIAYLNEQEESKVNQS